MHACALNSYDLYVLQGKFGHGPAVRKCTETLAGEDGLALAEEEQEEQKDKTKAEECSSATRVAEVENLPDAIVKSKQDALCDLGVRFPFIPGCEVAGTVVDLGASCTRFKLGDAVCGISSLFL